MNRLERLLMPVVHRSPLLLLAALLAFSGPVAQADPATHYFTGTVTSVFGIGGKPEFTAFTGAVTLSGSVTFEGGSPDADGSPIHGYFENITLDLQLDVPGLGEWSSVNNGFCELWNNHPDLFSEGDAISFVGAQSGTRIGPDFGNSIFTSVQLTLVDNSPPGTPDMLSDDSLPGSLAGWERGFVYLNYADYTDGFVPTTVRLEFTPIMAVPEPSAFALLVFGAGALGWLRRQRRA